MNVEIKGCLLGLSEKNVNFIVTGGVGAVLYGIFHWPSDLDIIPDPDIENLKRLSEYLQTIGAKPKYWGGGMSAHDCAVWTPSYDSIKQLQHRYNSGFGDLDIVSSGETTYHELLRRSVTVSAWGSSFQVAGLSDLEETRRSVVDDAGADELIQKMKAQSEEIGNQRNIILSEGTLRLLDNLSMRYKEGHGGPGLDPGYPVGLALSGGGHRASLFSLGVLMALKDLSILPQQISSVSGGSITNAFLAHRYFAEPSRKKGKGDELWERATLELFDTIVKKGAVTKQWIYFLKVLLLFPPLAFVIAGLFNILPPLEVTIPIGLGWLIVVFLRGMLIEWILSKTYFGSAFRRVFLKTLANAETEHVICCTDLISGRPLYATTRETGQVFRRHSDKPAGIGPRTVITEKSSHEIWKHGTLYSAPEMSVASAVRASAGFPGIPPRRLQLKKFDRSEKMGNGSPALSTIAFLSDGGIWNNLATQPFEDGFLWGDYGPWVILVADASSPLKFAGTSKYHLPGIAEILALVRQGIILNINTVEPRRANYQDWIRRELSESRNARFASERLYPVISCMETPEELRRRLAHAVQESSWNDGFLIDSERGRRIKDREKTKLRAQHLDNPTDPTGSDGNDAKLDPQAATNFKKLTQMASVKYAGTASGEHAADPVANYPTTLDKIDRQTALAIVGRGYANTAVTLYLTRLTDRLAVPKGWLHDHANN